MGKHSFKEDLRDNKLIIRLSNVEKERLKSLADKYTEGNASKYIRHAVMNWNPEKGDDDGSQLSKL